MTIAARVGEMTILLVPSFVISPTPSMVGEMTIAPGHVDETDGGRSPLLPDRRPIGDLFVCDIFDAAPSARSSQR
jgi:hypothetical protein